MAPIMAQTLQDIIEHKKHEVAQAKKERNIASIIKQNMPTRRDFLGAIRDYGHNGHNIGGGDFAVIAELKKASPSAGIIRKDFNVPSLTLAYQSAGACCLSVLTERHFFQGDIDFILEAKKNCDLPILRKDFIIDEWQIAQSRLYGADAILLILAAIDDKQLHDFYQMACDDYGMDVLVEIHDMAELERALQYGVKLVGINNRNLKSLKVDMKTSYDLLPHIPQSCYAISESGIKTHSDLVDLSKFGASGFLVGESLMRQDDIGLALRNLLNGEGNHD